MHRIFLVDAFCEECEMYAEYLSLNGFQVHTFDVPETALASARVSPPDAIVTRVRQDAGHIDGITLTANVRADSALRHIPVIVITTSILRGDRDAAVQAGSDDYVLLPMTPDDLVRDIRQLLLHRRTLK